MIRFRIEPAFPALALLALLAGCSSESPRAAGQTGSTSSTTVELARLQNEIKTLKDRLTLLEDGPLEAGAPARPANGADVQHALCVLLQQTNEQALQQALYLAAHLGPHNGTVRERLMAIARDPKRTNYQRRQALSLLLRDADGFALSLCLSLLRDPDVELQQASLRALGQSNNRDNAPPILELLGQLKENESAQVLPPARYAALEALKNLNDPRALAAFQQALRSPHSAIQILAVEGLGRLAHSESLPQIIELAERLPPITPGVHPSAHLALINALAQFKDKRAVGVLLKLLELPHDQIAVAVLNIDPQLLGAAPVEILWPLYERELRKLNAGDQGALWRAQKLITCVATTGGKDAAARLLKIIADKHPQQLMQAAAQALQPIAVPEFTAQLIELHAQCSDTQTKNALAAVLRNGKFDVRWNEAGGCFLRNLVEKE